MKNKPQLYQSVTLTFNDNTKGTFTGKAVVQPGDEEKISVVAIHFTKPKPLQPGFAWEELP